MNLAISPLFISEIDAFKGALQKLLVLIKKIEFSELSSYFGMSISN